MTNTFGGMHRNNDAECILIRGGRDVTWIKDCFCSEKSVFRTRF